MYIKLLLVFGFAVVTFSATIENPEVKTTKFGDRIVKRTPKEEKEVNSEKKLKESIRDGRTTNDDKAKEKITVEDGKMNKAKITSESRTMEEKKTKDEDKTRDELKTGAIKKKDETQTKEVKKLDGKNTTEKKAKRNKEDLRENLENRPKKQDETNTNVKESKKEKISLSESENLGKKETKETLETETTGSKKNEAELDGKIVKIKILEPEDSTGTAKPTEKETKKIAKPENSTSIIDKSHLEKAKKKIEKPNRTRRGRARFVPSRAIRRTLQKTQEDDSASKEFVPIISQDLDVEPEGAFRWSYESADGSRASQIGEVKTVGENVTVVMRGSFSYVGDDGKTYSVTYLADEDGFQPEGDHLPEIPKPAKEVESKPQTKSRSNFRS